MYGGAHQSFAVVQPAVAKEGRWTLSVDSLPGAPGGGWGSSGLHPYRPLGHMEQHVTPIRFMAARHVNQVKVVDPDVPELPVGEARCHD